MSLQQRLSFFRGYLSDPTSVGSLAPSSPGLARALCTPLMGRSRPARILEVGAGTGAITRHLGLLLHDEDELDICEIQPEFVGILQRHVLTGSDFAAGVAAGRIRLLSRPLQELPAEDHYDFVISGLPMNGFELSDVQDVFAVIRRSLKPGGVLSYFEYAGLRRASRWLALGRRRKRIRSVSAYLTSHIREHQFKVQTVLGNLPPARARHLRFSSSVQES